MKFDQMNGLETISKLSDFFSDRNRGGFGDFV